MQVVLQEPAPGRVVVSLDGELDMATGPALIDAVAQVVDRGAIGQLVVDLDNLEFLDSSGVHALVRAREMAVKASAAFEVHRPRTMVAHVLSVAGVSDLLRVVPAEGLPAPSPRGSRPGVAER